MLHVASSCWLSRCPASAYRVALPCPRVALLAAAPPCPTCASPCPARAEPLYCPHCPAARHPTARAARLLPALLVGALLPAHRPTGNRTSARTALPAPTCFCHPCCAPPCWPTPCCPCAALLPAHRLAGSRTALPCPRAALLAAALPCVGRFDTWLDDLQLYLLSDSRDSVSLFDHTSGVSLAPPATAESATGTASVAAVVTAVGVGVGVGVVAAAVVADGVGLFRGEVLAVARGSSSCVGTYGKFQTQHCCFSRLDDAWRAEFGDNVERHRWLELLRSGVDIFALDYDAILAAIYALVLRLMRPCTPSHLVQLFLSRQYHPHSTPCTCSSLHLPSFSTNLVSTAALQDVMVTTTTPGGSSLYTLATEPPQVAASAQVSMSGPVAPPCSCRLLSHQTLLLHHCLSHPSLPRLRGMHSHLLDSGLPRSLPPLPPSLAPPCLPCVEGRQRAAPHSSSFPPTTAPLQTLHMDIKGEVPDVLIPCIRAVRLQLRKRFTEDLPILRLHSDIGAPHWLSHGGGSYLHDPCSCSPFFVAVCGPVRCASAQPLAPCLLAGDLANTALDGEGWRCVGVPGLGLSFRCFSILPRSSSPPSLFPASSLAFPLTHLVGSFTTPPCTESSPFRTSRPPPVDPLPPQGPAPSGVSQVDPLPLVVPVEVAIDSDAARSAASRGAASGGAEPANAEPGGAEPEGEEPGGAESKGAESGGAEPKGAEPGGTEHEGAEPGGAESEGAESGGAEPRGIASAGGPLLPHSPLPAPSPYTEQTDPFTERREPETRPASPVCAVRTGRRVPRPRPPLVPGTHIMALRPSSVPLRVPLPPPPESSLPAIPDPESNLARAASPTVPRLLATMVTDPSFESTAVSALVAELVTTPLENFECLAAAVPHLVAMLLAPEGDPDAPDIPTPRSYAEAITVPPSGANIVDGMWIFRVKRPSGSPPVFKARYVARGFSQRQGVDFFQTFSPTPKMTTLRVLLHVAAQRDYELHSLDFSTVFLQGSLYEEIWLRHPPGLTGSFPAAPPSDESVEPSGPYLDLVGCLIYLMTCTRPDLAYPLSILARYVAPERHRPEHWEANKRVLRYLCRTSGMGLMLGGRGRVVLTGRADASWVDELATQWSSQGYTFSLGSASVSWRSTRSSSVLSSSYDAEIYAGAMAAQELHWLTYLLTDLGERPRSSPFRT
ncbi:unnamed protein product [Closterium sp. NIES-53]